jgi:carboxylesterase type B
VTVMGQSSGGTSVFALLSSRDSVGLFSAAVSLSGSPNVSMALDVAERQNAPMVAAMGWVCVGGWVCCALAVPSCVRVHLHV